MNFYFLDLGWRERIIAGNENKRGLKDIFRYGFSWGREEDDRYGNQKQNNLQEYDLLTPEVLSSLIEESIVLAEETIRRHADSHYKWLVRRREEYIENREQRRLATIRRHEQEVQQLLKKRIDLIEDAIDRIDRADRLRSLIAAFDQKAQSSNEPLSGFEKWKRWATDQACRIDPRNMSIKHAEQWIAKFHLHA